jgi:hypothetical protein
MALLLLAWVPAWVQPCMQRTTETTEISIRSVKFLDMVDILVLAILELAILEVLVMVNLAVLDILVLRVTTAIQLAISKTKLTVQEFALVPMKLEM